MYSWFLTALLEVGIELEISQQNQNSNKTQLKLSSAKSSLKLFVACFTLLEHTVPTVHPEINFHMQ